MARPRKPLKRYTPLKRRTPLRGRKAIRRLPSPEINEECSTPTGPDRVLYEGTSSEVPETPPGIGDDGRGADSTRRQAWPHRSHRIRARSPRKAALYAADAKLQREVSGYGECPNCKTWAYLSGHHLRKRRHLDTRHDRKNVLPVCWPCNVAFESVPLADLIKRYPDSPLRPEWEERYREKYPGRSLLE
jgi:hypothetical protein